MRKTLLVACGTALGLSLSASPVIAQNLQMVDAPRASSVSTPGRGLSMGQVEQRFGAPSRRVAAVGQPPISRWVYPGFIVYFEGSRVLHCVTTERAPTT
jgi:hypothetical protein